MTAPAPPTLHNHNATRPSAKEKTGLRPLMRMMATPEILVAGVALVLSVLVPISELNGFNLAGSLTVIGIVIMYLALVISAGEWLLASAGAAVFFGFVWATVDLWQAGPTRALVPSLAAIALLEAFRVNFSRRRAAELQAEPYAALAVGWIAVVSISLAIAMGLVALTRRNNDITWVFELSAVAMLGICAAALMRLLRRTSTHHDSRRFTPGQRLLPPPRR